MSDIFICYARADRAVATRLAGVLRAQGWSVFLDTDTAVGQRWHQKIERELHAARAVVALWSATSRQSDFVLDEAEYAKRKGILFPAFIERVEFPYGFGRIQTADMVGWAGEPDHRDFVQLLASLRDHLHASPTAEHGEVASTPDDRRTSPRTAARATQPPPAAPRPARTPLAPGRTFRDALNVGGEGPLVMVVPAGRFLMGSPKGEPQRSDHEGPQHEVRFARPFAIGVYAITFDEYDLAVRHTDARSPEDRGWGRGKRPVIDVSWQDAQVYCDWLSKQTGRDYRLPSEAEWEYACRAGTTTPFHFAGPIDASLANYDARHTYAGSAKGAYRQRTEPVGSFPPNAFGLHEMHGNVWEWCQDAWHGSYQGAPSDGSVWEGGDSGHRVLRGGSWNLNPGFCRAAYRNGGAPGGRSGLFGFRVCCGVPIE